MVEYLHGIVDDFVRYWPVYSSIPLVAALIGWVTKLVAIRMMFEPIEFVGIRRRGRPFLGWQGIVPRRAARMAGIAVDTMTEQLISPRDVVQRLDPERIGKEIEAPLREAIEEIVTDVAERYQPDLWERLPDRARRMVIRRVQKQAPHMVARVIDQVKADVDSVFDLKDMVVTHLVKDKTLLNRIFQEAGHKEFRFIGRSGLLFGALIGVVQMIVWLFLRVPLVMPVFGLFIGWFTDWLALKMIFRPLRPRKYFGVTWQGLFLKRRDEVTDAYADLIATEIITPRNVIDAVLRGPMSDRVLTMIERQVDAELARHTGAAKPLVLLAMGGGRYGALKDRIAGSVMTRLPDTLRYVETYAADAMDIRGTLVTKMRELDDAEFEGLLRPAFQQDEWILILTGALLGGLCGELQVQLVLLLTG
ncbi:hypothetical protein GCM10009676_22400 [Prauserella halophila]|uniref:DUF445 domain-containing protein n=1 Tax=Prauserella halophila TaxID=185641 RepID=A0ABP4GXM0_9PSEU|nr:DUF445 family protein [Prauserella halophila]MCP2235567.1 Protein of unknown function (DUF445) [Prauserella halophila]